MASSSPSAALPAPASSSAARHALAAHLLDEEEALIKLADHAHNLRVANDRRGASIHEIAAVGSTAGTAAVRRVQPLVAERGARHEDEPVAPHARLDAQGPQTDRAGELWEHGAALLHEESLLHAPSGDALDLPRRTARDGRGVLRIKPPLMLRPLPRALQGRRAELNLEQGVGLAPREHLARGALQHDGQALVPPQLDPRATGGDVRHRTQKPARLRHDLDDRC